MATALSESLTRAYASTLYLHRREALRPAVSLLEQQAKMMFVQQGYDVLAAIYAGRTPLSEAHTTSKEEQRRRTALILAAIVAALERRLSKDISLLTTGLSRALAIALLKAGLAHYGISANLRDIAAQRWIEAHGAELVKGINQYTRERLSTIIAKALSSGLSADDLAREIVLSFSDMTYARAYRIAVTEASKAWSFAESESARLMEEAGFTMVKEWLLGPLHPRYDLCDDNEQAGAIPIAQPFPSGDMYTPQHPHCGCGVVTYPDPGMQQPWGTTILGQIPLVPWPGNNEVST